MGTVLLVLKNQGVIVRLVEPGDEEDMFNGYDCETGPASILGALAM